MSYRFLPPRGFTLVELLLVVAIIGMLAILTAQQFAEDRDALRDRTLAANLDVIQTAIERYHTDTGQYPLFLLGGDVEGWRLWHATYDEAKPDPTLPQNAWLHDPLILGGYLTAYPTNPFIDDGGKAVRLQTGGSDTTIGDPRFGALGNLAGNGVDDPRVFKSKGDWDTAQVETWRTQVAARDDPAEARPYAFGGRRRLASNGKFRTVATWWPGNFLYRSVVLRQRSTKDCYWYPRPNLPLAFLWRGVTTGSYLLGSYGAKDQPGLDVVRLETTDPAGNQLYYRTLYFGLNSGYQGVYRLGLGGKVESGVGVGIPEVIGGGSAWHGPFMPFNPSPGEFRDGPIQFGAPDGVPDGIAEVRTGPSCEEVGWVEAL